MASLDDITDLASKTDLSIKERTELGEVMESLEKDHSGNSIINTTERGSLLVLRELHRLGIIEDIEIAQSFLGLSVSVGGVGREQKVRSIQGEREVRSGSGFMGGLKGLFQKRQ